MQVKQLTANQREEWNTFTAQAPYFALQQSWEWGEFKEELGWKVFRIAVEDRGHILAGAQLLIRSIVPGFISFSYIPLGPLGNWLNNDILNPLFCEIHQIARNNHALLLKIEPSIVKDQNISIKLCENNFIPSLMHNQSQTTIIIDLLQDQNQILSQMRKTTRRKIINSSKKGIIVQVGNEKDIPAFYQLLKINSKRSGFVIRNQEYYQFLWKIFAPKNETLLLLAIYQDKLIAASWIFGFGRHLAFFFQASSGEYSNLNPNTLLVWESIKWGKEHGYVTFDFWGIPDEISQIVSAGEELPEIDRTDGLWGVYKFKSGFGRNIVCYIGAFDYTYNPFLYKLISGKLVTANVFEQLSSWLESRKSLFFYR